MVVWWWKIEEVNGLNQGKIQRDEEMKTETENEGESQRERDRLRKRERERVREGQIKRWK